ncbi:MAG TPA: translation initiation factor [Phycisphaerae bacterium]|nr:translation initiation factor [Phycisphaerae bacterium]
MSRLFSGTPFDRPPTCEICHKPKTECRCLNLPEKKKMSAGKGERRLDSGLVLNPENSTPPKDQAAVIRTEKRKGDRFITVITGLDHPANDLPKLCTELKSTLGVGGSVQGRSVELQGDHRERVAELLREKGLRVKG